MDLYTLTQKLKTQISDLSLPEDTMGRKEKLPDQLGVIDSMTPESLKLED